MIIFYPKMADYLAGGSLVPRCNFTEKGDWSMQKVTGESCETPAQGDKWYGGYVRPQETPLPQRDALPSWFSDGLLVLSQEDSLFEQRMR